MKLIWDTNVVSELGSARPNPKVKTWAAQQSAGDSAISIVTMAELRVGALTAGNKRRSDELGRWIEDVVSRQFDERVLPVTVDILTDWLLLGRQLAGKRTTRDAADMLIASTARVHDLIVVTRNTRDFVGAGVTIYNPWTNETQRMAVI